MNRKNELIRFLVSGVVVTTTDFAIYFLLIHVLPISFAKGISFTAAGIVGYLLNKYWTFQQEKSSYAEMGRYWTVNVIAFGLNVFINHQVLRTGPEGVWLALISATLVTSVFTYVGFKWWVFKPKAINQVKSSIHGRNTTCQNSN